MAKEFQDVLMEAWCQEQQIAIEKDIEVCVINYNDFVCDCIIDLLL